MSYPKINYLEFPAKDLAATKQFFITVFGWVFEDFGPDYTSFSDAGIDGGFYKSALSSTPDNGAALVVFYSKNLEETLRAIEAAAGIIVNPTFAFPGGRRFHFTEPSGNEFAVWSDQEA